MNIDGVQDPIVRTALKAIDRDIQMLSAKVAQTSRSSIEEVGGVRAGPPSARGTATDRHPEVFIQIDTPGLLVTFFITTPTDTSGGAYEWSSLGTVTLT